MSSEKTWSPNDHESFWGNQTRKVRVEERFWSKVYKSDGCWIWLAFVSPDGYGRFGLNGKTEYAHRVAFFLTYGRWPAPETDHTCRTLECVRPEHLEEVTKSGNALRREETKRSMKEDA